MPADRFRVALSIVLSLAGAAIVMRQNPQDRVIALLQHGREISPEPSAKITQHAQLSPTVASEVARKPIDRPKRERRNAAGDGLIKPAANEPQGAIDRLEAGRSSTAPQPDVASTAVAIEPQGSQSIARSGETSQPAPQPDGSTAPVANEPQGSQSIARSRETSQPTPQADGSTAPVARMEVAGEANRSPEAGRSSQPRAPQADGSTAPVASELQGSQSIARSGETSQPAPQADSGTLPEAARAAMVIASQDKPQAPPDRRPRRHPRQRSCSPSMPRSGPLRPRRRWRAKVVEGVQPRTPNLHRIAKLSKTCDRQDRRDRAQCSGRDARANPSVLVR